MRIGWTYDDLYSLSVIADRGLDADWDGALTAEEEAALAGFDMDWMAGFCRAIPMPSGATRIWCWARRRRPDGQLWRGQDHLYPSAEFSRRRLRSGEGRFAVQVYDPGFYTSYAIVGDGVLTGGSRRLPGRGLGPGSGRGGCRRCRRPWRNIRPMQSVEADFPAVGRTYAEEVRVTCAAR